MLPPRLRLLTLVLGLLAIGSDALAISSRTLVSPTAQGPFNFFGWSSGSAGDMNGDGYDDIIVGAYVAANSFGLVYVYFGGPGADANFDLIIMGLGVSDEFGYSVGTAGDVNGDGFADVIVGAHNNDAAGNNAGRAYVISAVPGSMTFPISRSRARRRTIILGFQSLPPGT